MCSRLKKIRQIPNINISNKKMEFIDEHDIFGFRFNLGIPLVGCLENEPFLVPIPHSLLTFAISHFACIQRWFSTSLI